MKTTQKGKHNYHIHADDYDFTKEYERLYMSCFWAILVFLLVLSTIGGVIAIVIKSL